MKEKNSLPQLVLSAENCVVDGAILNRKKLKSIFAEIAVHGKNGLSVIVQYHWSPKLGSVRSRVFVGGGPCTVRRSPKKS